MPMRPRRRLTVLLDPDAADRLSTLADREKRPPRLQAAVLLEKALRRTDGRVVPLHPNPEPPVAA